MQLAEFQNNFQAAHAALSKVVLGHAAALEHLLVALFADGHVMLTGVPGLGRTLLVKSAAKVLGLSFNRVQFTPDLLPTDITGTEVLQESADCRTRSFRFFKGPIFANLVLADEINRTPPKTQAALLEAMQEIQVTAGGERYDLPRPFFVLATQNPIEQEGTYSLPEAQLDRFMFQINVDYPNQQEELEVLDLTTTSYKPEIVPVLGAEEILPLQALVRKVIVSQELKEYVVRLVRTTRPGREGAPDFVGKWVSWGAGPRASQNLVLGAKAWALLNGRHEVNAADVRFVAGPVLGHRLVCNFAAEAEGISSSKVVQKLLETVR
jgi:MoxR-like ATPase